MQKGHLLQFNCKGCNNPVYFSLFEIDENPTLSCSRCHKKYLFGDETLKRQLKKFEDLCKQIIESEEILANTSVGIDVGDHHVKVPYKLLLTRLSSSLQLLVGNDQLSIDFRMEPLRDIPKELFKKS